MKQEKIFKIKTEYYTDNILKQMLSQICFLDFSIDCSNFSIFREVAILSNNKIRNIALRCLTFSNTQNGLDFFKKTFFNLKYPETFLNNDASFYCSVARLYKFPSFPFKNRTSFTNKFYKEEYINYIAHYDIYLDFDIDLNKNIKQEIARLINDLQIIIYIIKKYHLKAEIVFSGNRGFKVLIYNPIYLFLDAIKIRTNIQKRFYFYTLDNSGSFVSSKLMKLNYSLVIKKNNIKICLPINENEIKNVFTHLRTKNNFNIFNYNYDNKLNVLKNISDFLILETYNNKNFIDFVNDYKLLLD